MLAFNWPLAALVEAVDHQHWVSHLLPLQKCFAAPTLGALNVAGPKLKRVREWAQEQTPGGSEPPWAGYQYLDQYPGNTKLTVGASF